MKDKKRSFWILLLIFSFLAIAGMMINRQNQAGSMADMMSISMGGMMKQQHVSNLTVAGLIGGAYEDHGMSMGDMAGHHDIPPILQSIGFLTTMIIFLGLPLLLGGTVLLLVLWT